MKSIITLEIISYLLFILFLYTSFSKFFDWDLYVHAMYSQSFPDWIAKILILFLPPVEIIIAFLIINTKSKLTGLVAAAILLSLFTLYALISVFLPPDLRGCPCGGMLAKFSWNEHLIFNFLFLTISLTGIFIYKKNPKNISRAKPGYRLDT